MKRLLFILCAALSIVSCSKQENAIEESSASEHLSFWWQKHDSINHAYVETADPIWQFGRHGEDIYDWSYQEKWYYGCRNVLINSYDSIHPGKNGEDKDLRMLDELIQFFEFEPDNSTMGMIISNDLGENFTMYKLVATSIPLLTWQNKKHTIREEINTWNDFHRLLNRFCLNMMYLGWYGGSGAGPACTALSYNITNQRLKDVERLNHFNHDELPMNYLICTDMSKCQFENAVDSVIIKRKLTPKAHQWYTDSEYAGYDKEYYKSVAIRDSLIDAYLNWVHARKYLLEIDDSKQQRDTMIAVVTNLVLLSGED